MWLASQTILTRRHGPGLPGVWAAGARSSMWGMGEHLGQALHRCHVQHRSQSENCMS